MNDYAIVSLSQSGTTTIVLFESLTAAHAHIEARRDQYADLYLWYIVRILERSQAETAAACELLHRGSTAPC